MADAGSYRGRGGAGSGEAFAKKARSRVLDDKKKAGDKRERERLLLLLGQYSASPIKKAKRSSGDLLEATGQDGKVLPELLSEQKDSPAVWTKSSATTQLLTFGASWDSRRDVEFLNPATDSSDGDGSKPTKNGKDRARLFRRHSDPIPTTAIAAAIAASARAAAVDGTDAGAEAGTEAGVNAWAGAEARLGKKAKATMSGSGKATGEGRAGGSIASNASGLGISADSNYSLSRSSTLSQNSGKFFPKRRAGSTGSTGLVASAAAAALSRTDIDYAASLRGDRTASSRTSFKHAACVPEGRYSMGRTCIDHTATFLGRSSAAPRTGTDRAAPFEEGFAASSRGGIDRALYARGDDFAGLSQTGSDRTAQFGGGSAAGPRIGNDRPASYRLECFGGADQFSRAGPEAKIKPKTESDLSGSGFLGVRRNSCALREGSGPQSSNAAGLGAATPPGTAAVRARAVAASLGIGEVVGKRQGRVKGKVAGKGKGGGGRAESGGGTGAVVEEDSLFYLPAVDVRDMGLSVSPAASVESDFWGDTEATLEGAANRDGRGRDRTRCGDGDGDGDDDDGDDDDDDDDDAANEGFDPKEAVHAALDRLMSASSGRSRAAGSAVGPGGDVRMLENLLLENLRSNSDGKAIADGSGDADSSRNKGGKVDGGSRRGARRNSGSSSSSSSGGRTKGRRPDRDPTDNNNNNNNNNNPITPANKSGGPPPEALSRGKSTSTNASTASGGKGSGSQGKGGRKHRRVGSEDDEASPALSNASTSTPRSGSDSSASPGSTGSTAASTLTPSLWKLVERGDTCPFADCAFTVSMMEERAKRSSGGGKGKMEGGRGEGAKGQRGAGGGGGKGGRVGSGVAGEERGDAEGDEGGEAEDEAEVEANKNKSRCRHFHTLCGCRHTRGALKGLLFQTNQLDKARNHQRKHAQPAVPTGEAAQLAPPNSRDSTTSPAWGGTLSQDASMTQDSQDEMEVVESGSQDVETGDLDGEDGDGFEGGGKRGGARGGSTGSRDGRRTWTDAESDRLREVVEHRNAGDVRKNWQWVAARVCEAGGGRKTPSQCKMRWERILNPGVKKGLWTKEEDQKLKEIAAAMEYKWSHVAKVMGGRTYKQCRERYTNYLKDGLNCGPWSKEEDEVLLLMHAKIGNKWAEIARHLKDRSENMIKNEYMKLSRDATHRRVKGEKEALLDAALEGSGDKKAKKKKVKRMAKAHSSAHATAAAGGRGETPSDHEEPSRKFPVGGAGGGAPPPGRLPVPPLVAGPGRGGGGGGGGGHASIELVDELDKLLFPPMAGLHGAGGGGLGAGKGGGLLGGGGGGGASGTVGDVFVDDSPVRV